MKALRLLFAIVCVAGLSLAAAQDDTSFPTDREALSRPLPGLTTQEMALFQQGRSLVRQSWVVAPAGDRAVNGLGPLYNRLACISCHAKNGRGGAPDGPQQRMQSMLVRLSVPGVSTHGGPRPHPAYGDQLNEEGIAGVPGEGLAHLQWLPSWVTLAGGERIALRRPRLSFDELGYGPMGKVLTSLRVSPPIAGLGLLETVPAAALTQRALAPKPDGVRGTVNQVWDVPSGLTVPGRFGLKANAPSLRQQIAGAFVGDMGITSDLFPAENCTEVQLACQQAPSGAQPELTTAQLDSVEFYLAHLAPPERRQPDAPLVRQGEALFVQSGCAICHQPVLPGGEHPKYPRLSGQPVAAYTDLLVHDLGPALTDGRPDYLASGRQWRTAPLWGLGLLVNINEATHFLHDGRARTVQEAILWHGGEAKPARHRYASLSKSERQALLAFLQSL